MTTDTAAKHLIDVGGKWVELLADGDAIVRMMRNGKEWEPQTRAMWGSMVRADEMVLDVGAYTGIYSIASAMLGAKAVAFEPHPANYTRLLANAAINSVRVNAIQAAASDYTGSALLGSKKTWEHISDTAGMDLGEHFAPVSVMRIDDLRFTARVALIKIDVEYSEVPVLLGAKNTIGAHGPAIIVEALNDIARASIAGVMDGLNYETGLVLDGRNWLYVCR